MHWLNYDIVSYGYPSNLALHKELVKVAASKIHIVFVMLSWNSIYKP